MRSFGVHIALNRASTKLVQRAFLNELRNAILAVVPVAIEHNGRIHPHGHVVGGNEIAGIRVEGEREAGAWNRLVLGGVPAVKRVGGIGDGQSPRAPRGGLELKRKQLPNVALLVGEDEVLARHGVGLPRGAKLLPRARVRRVLERAVLVAGLVASPLHRERRALPVLEHGQIGDDGAHRALADAAGGAGPEAALDLNGAGRERVFGQARHVKERGADALHVGAAPGDVRVAAQDDEGDAWDREARDVVAGAAIAESTPEGGEREAHVRVIGEDRLARACPRAGDNERVAASLAHALHKVERGFQRLLRTAWPKAWARGVLELGEAGAHGVPVRVTRHAQMRSHRAPVDVSACKAAYGDDVAQRPGLVLKAQHAGLVWALGGAGAIVVEPLHIPLEPRSRVRTHRRLDLSSGFRIINEPQRMADVHDDRNRPGDFSKSALADQPQDFHLTQPQMSVHKADGVGHVAVVGGVDERNLMLAPVNGERGVVGEGLRLARGSGVGLRCDVGRKRLDPLTRGEGVWLRRAKDAADGEQTKPGEHDKTSGRTHKHLAKKRAGAGSTAGSDHATVFAGRWDADGRVR